MRMVEVAELDLSFTPAPWSFAAARASDIAAHWAELTAKKPALYNGRVLLARCRLETDAGRAILRGAFFETDYASFAAWRAFGYPGEPVENCFSMAALKTADGAFLLGEMAAHTHNGGQVYFPAGTPDPSDIFGGRVDLDASARRELFEETGIDAAAATIAPGWTVFLAGPKIACMKLMTLPFAAEEARARIEAFLARDPEAEFSRIHVVRAAGDLDESRTPPFVTAYLKAALSNP